MCGTIKYCNTAEKTSVPKASQLRLKGQSSVPLYMQRWRSQPGFWPPAGSPCKGAPTAQTTQGAKDKGPRTCLSLHLITLHLTTLHPDLSGRKQAPYTAWISTGNLTLREKEGPRNPCEAKVTPPPTATSPPTSQLLVKPSPGTSFSRPPGTHAQPAQPRASCRGRWDQHWSSGSARWFQALKTQIKLLRKTDSRRGVGACRHDTSLPEASWAAHEDISEVSRQNWRFP